MMQSRPLRVQASAPQVGFKPEHLRQEVLANTGVRREMQPIVISPTGQSQTRVARTQGAYSNRQYANRQVRYQADQQIMIDDGYEGEILHGEYIEGSCGDCGQCDACAIYCPPYQLISFADMEYSFGVQGFKSVPNLGQSGSFGFHQAINWGFPISVFPNLDLAGQGGVRFIQSDLNGANFTTQSRSQTFWTAGISRRVDYGLQFGLVVDGLEDNWYFNATFAQLRGEMSMVGGYGNTFGVRYTANLSDDTPGVSTGLAAVGFGGITTFDNNDTYRLFCRHSWDETRGGYAEMFGGFSENGEGVFGTEFMIPIAEHWGLTSDFTFLLPTGGTPANDAIDESWNIGMGLTWYPKGLSTWSKLYHRPLLDVADNGTFLFKR